MAFVRVNPGDPMQAHQLNQVIDALTGAVGAGVPIAPTAVNDASNYALTVQNDDATNSRALLVLKQDGTTLIQADKNGVVLALANGSVPNAALGSDTARANLLTNGSFEIWQRGVGPFSGPSVYCADRWITQVIGTDSLSVSRSGAGTVDVGSQYSAGCTFTLGTGAGGTALYQLNKLTDYAVAGKTLTVSVRVATAVAGAVRVRINSDGTGSPTNQSAFAAGLGGFETLTASITVPTNATNFVVALYFSASCNAYIDNAMLVVGSQPADYAPLHPADDLARCLRYYEVWGGKGQNWPQVMGYSGAGQSFGGQFTYHAVKAVSPTVTKNGTWGLSNCGQPSLGASDVDGVFLQALAGVVGFAQFYSSAAGQTLTIEANP